MDQLLKFVNNLNSAQRAVIIGGFSLLLVLLLGLLIYSNVKAEDSKLNYTIATNLTKNQVMLASNELEASGILFSVVGSGNSLTLKTSKEFINIAKIKLVTSDAATSKHVGWEIFEKSSLGTTNFENKVKYLRALEGELSRSLESLSGILRASVKLAIPKETIFTERKTPPTASAVLTLKPGVYLTQKQIDGIKNFIASAIPNLTTNNIKLIDQDGSILEQSKEEADNLSSVTQNKYKKRLEKDFESKIVDLLEPFVGKGRVVARVSLSLNFSKKHTQEEIYEPEGTIRSQQTTESTSSSDGVVKDTAAVPGVQSNIQAPQPEGNKGTNSSKNETSKNIVNYEISKRVIDHEDKNYSTINKITAAVTFDSAALTNVQNKDEFINNIVEVVQDTIGYDEKRGDKITVKDFKFVTYDNKANLDANGNPIVEDSGDTIGMVKAILAEFSEYFQYLIALILLFIFYRKFIVKNDVVILSDGLTSSGTGKAGGGKGKDINIPGVTDDTKLEDEFNLDSAKGRLKSKVRSQILNNLEGLDEESAAKYEVLIEEIDRIINNEPAEMAKMIELLLSEDTGKKYNSKKGK
ncbi:flagellar M-ring protein FliF [Arcobacter nitrofigilis DSM 7299]|uniref:Flagellar M-ring protein n=1 Tax=Arcobacter nitrofigilis (strain ATCC 33309 / DSM 7299 / CCUG 15893 / LMG 7604 / NCTC 12251 / CI) TaxID=572480 RepID=D5V681_ARCNC|nr:flagellar basal-body MS-ring/collar protein FliF [Arcobacter nitrofigilis]ADG94151.1 flagellar M-ring protein FliF [Arcobacter nitrofigilis DSM 7299]